MKLKIDNSDFFNLGNVTYSKTYTLDELLESLKYNSNKTLIFKR